VFVLSEPNKRNKSVIVALSHPYTEYATSSDIILNPSASGLSYALVVELGVIGVVFSSQLDQTPLGRVSNTAQKLAPRGTNTMGFFDARLLFKKKEREDLYQLTQKCTNYILQEL